MKIGHYSDNEIPEQEVIGYSVNSRGYRCSEFSPLPDGGKNTVVLGCSHTFGIGLDANETWVNALATRCSNTPLRFWNLGTPGASCDRLVRTLYGCEKVLYPKVIIMCWPSFSRRERLEVHTENLTGGNRLLATETDQTDRNNLLKNVFLTEKIAEHTGAKVFHCFAEEAYLLPNKNSLHETTLKQCWPEWDKHHLADAKREVIKEPSLAKDGLHYGKEHHETFAEKFYNKFGLKLK